MSVLVSGGWNRGVPPNTEVSSFQGVLIERFHCIQVSSFQGVLIERFHCIQVSSFQGVLIERFHCIQVSSFQGVLIERLLYTGVLISGGSNREVTVYRCPHFREF